MTSCGKRLRRAASVSLRNGAFGSGVSPLVDRPRLQGGSKGGVPAHLPPLRSREGVRRGRSGVRTWERQKVRTRESRIQSASCKRGGQNEEDDLYFIDCTACGIYAGNNAGGGRASGGSWWTPRNVCTIVGSVSAQTCCGEEFGCEEGSVCEIITNYELRIGREGNEQPTRTTE